MVETVEVTAECAVVPRPGWPEAGAGPSWVEPIPGTSAWATLLSPPATKTWPPIATAAAPASDSGRRPMTLALCRAGSMAWMTSTGWPARGPVMASPPKAKIVPPSAATAGYRTGTGSAATARKLRPSEVASTSASG